MTQTRNDITVLTKDDLQNQLAVDKISLNITQMITIHFIICVNW